MRYGILNWLRLSPLPFSLKWLTIFFNGFCFLLFSCCQTSVVVHVHTTCHTPTRGWRPPNLMCGFFFDGRCIGGYPSWTSMHGRLEAFDSVNNMMYASSDLEVKPQTSIQYLAESFLWYGGVETGWGRRLGTCVVHGHVVNSQSSTLLNPYPIPQPHHLPVTDNLVTIRKSNNK